MMKDACNNGGKVLVGLNQLIEFWGNSFDTCLLEYQ